MEHGRVYRLGVADSHHFEEQLDPDPQSEWIRIGIKVKSWIRIRIQV